MNDSMRLLPESMAKHRKPASSPIFASPLVAAAFPPGTPVVTSPYLPSFAKKKVWRFPADPFIEYDAGDEEWARSIGYGCEVEVDDPDAMVVFAFTFDSADLDLPTVSQPPPDQDRGIPPWSRFLPLYNLG